MADAPRYPRLSTNPESDHAFYELGARRFEHFVRAMHATQPSIIGAGLYGPDGQEQFGIDHVAFHKSDAGQYLEVGQAKAERRFGGGEIRKAADKFLEYWDSHWSAKNVRRFILFVGCTIKSAKAHDEIIEQTRRFDALGIQFEVWDAVAIYDHLPEANAAVRQFLGQDWYERIFGKPVGPLSGLLRDLESGFNLSALRLQDIVSTLNRAVSAEIVELKRRARRGEAKAVIAQLEVAVRSESHAALAPETRAQRLRILAGLLIGSGDAERVRSLLDEADRLDGDSEHQRAILLLETIGPQALLGSVPEDAVAELVEVRAVALLRLGQPSLAFAALERFLDDPEARAETLRLASLAKLVEGDRQRAVALAERAAASDTDSRACQQALAICVFHRALSPAVRAETGEWPQPIDQPLVQLSDSARADLERAESLFRALMAAPDLENHEAMVIWHFAVLACMPWRHAETVARLADLQASSTLPVPMIAWAISRALPFNRTAAKAQCDARIATQPLDFEALLIRIGLAIAEREKKRAGELLEAHKQALLDAGHDALYEYWRAIIDLEMRRSPSASTLKGHPWLRLRQAIDIRDRKRRLREIEAVLKLQLAQAGDARVILAATQLLLDAGWHKSAAEAAPYLIEQIGTAEAITAAALAYYRGDRAPDMLTALGHVGAFPDSKLPVELERLKANCLARTGALVSARNASLILARSTRQIQDVWHSIQLNLAIGAAPQALALYEEHAELLTTPAPGHIALARALVWSHPEAARSITRLLAADIPDDFVTAAFDLAHKLKLVAEQRMLTGRIQALGANGKGGVQLVTVEDIVRMAEQRREAVERAYELYANGNAPVHLLTGFRIGTLAAAYLEPLISPLRPSEARTLLSARYGRRFDAQIWPESGAEARLTVDISALLTGHGLGILDAVERCFAPVRIPPDTITALLTIRSDIEPGQPGRLEAVREVLALVDAGDVQDQTALPATDTFTVLWEGDGGEPSSTLSFARLFELLTGSLGSRIAETARELLGETLRPEATGARPPEGSVLILEPGMAATLQEAGVFEELTGHYRIGLQGDEIMALRAETAAATAAVRLIESLSALIARINTGIEDGTYQMVSFGTERDGDPVRRSFMQMLEALRSGDGIAWVDDRYISSVNEESFRIVTTVEVLEALVQRQRLSVAEEYALRQKLRAARWLFLPQRGDEIAHHLRAATSDGEVSETADLDVLRRAIGEVLSHRRRLQWPSQELLNEGAQGEIPFLLDSGHAVSDALAAIWSDESWSVEDAEAASAWILDTLEIGLFPMAIFAAGDPRADHLIGVHGGGLVLVALRVYSGKRLAKRQAAYLDWLWRHYLCNALRVRPEIRDGLESMIGAHLASEDGDIKDARLWRIFVANVINAMPLPLRASLLRRADLRKAFELPDHGQISIGDESFDEREFFSALIYAGSKPRKLESVSGKPATIALVKDGGTARLRLALGDSASWLDDWPRRAASENAATRLDALVERSDVLDLPDAALTALSAELGLLSDPIERVRLVLRRTHETQAQDYADLDTMARERTPFALSNLMLEDVEKLVRHLRLSSDVATAAWTLLEERGLSVAIRRLGGLPIAPPLALQGAVNALDDTDLTEALTALSAESSPPWVQLFLGSMVLAKPRSAAIVVRVRQWVEQALSPEAAPLWQLYISLADFTASDASAQPAWSQLSAAQQLAVCWGHANAITEILAAGRVRIESVTQSLRENRIVSPRFIVSKINKIATDVANPRWMTPDRMRIHVAAPVLFRLRAIEGQAEWAEGLLRALMLEPGPKGTPVPRMEIARNVLAGDDALPSLVAAPIGEMLETVHEGLRGLFRDGAHQLLEVLLSADEGSDERRAAWSLLRVFTNDGPLPQALAEQAKSAFDTADAGLDSEDLDDARYALMNLAALAGANGWEEAGARIDREVERLGPREGDDDVMVLFEIAVWRARMIADPMERTRNLAEALLQLGSHAELREQAEVAVRHFGRNLSGLETEAFIDALGTMLTRR